MTLKTMIPTFKLYSRNDSIYDMVTAMALAIVLIAIYFATEYPIPSIATTVLAAFAGISFYFLRHSPSK